MWKVLRDFELPNEKRQGSIMKTEECSHLNFLLTTKRQCSSQTKVEDITLNQSYILKTLKVFWGCCMMRKLHVQKVVDKFMKVLLLMRFLVGSEWGTDKTFQHEWLCGLWVSSKHNTQKVGTKTWKYHRLVFATELIFCKNPKSNLT